MLPPNFLTIPQIQRERHAGSKLMHLTTLLEYLLKLYNPNVTAAEVGKEPKVGERVIACQHIFSNFTRVLWALKVRNTFAHVTGNEFSERDHQNAVDCLIEAIGDVCGRGGIQPDIVAAIYHDPDAGAWGGREEEVRRQQERQAQAERERQARAEQAQKRRADELRLEELRQRLVQREMEIRAKKSEDLRRSIRSGFRWLIVIALLAAGGYFLWPKLVTLYKGEKGSAVVVRKEAELALKRVRDRRKQKEYGAVITQAEAAWRDGEIEFRRGNYRLAEGKYRELIGLWDSLNARVAESLSFEELLAEVNVLRQAASNAQALQRATDLWNQAEETRRNAETARRNGNLPEAKSLIIQARQQYETAQAAALAQAGETEASATPDEATPAATPTALPEPVQTPTMIVQPTVERRPEPTPPDRDGGSDGDDDAFTIGGVEDHVHLLVGLRATHRLADVLREIKASSSKWVHEELKKPLFSWQEGYGAFTVGASQIAAVKNYIANQEEHHRKKTFQEEYLEFLIQSGAEYDEKYLW
jgi:hypothetical protein